MREERKKKQHRQVVHDSSGRAIIKKGEQLDGVRLVEWDFPTKNLLRRTEGRKEGRKDPRENGTGWDNLTK